ncbi:MAG: inositol monophosphatase family protein [Elusimicrobia bacterium]|nr:inositol monophosphatase family protein [Elusimicrobiota bacterium]
MENNYFNIMLSLVRDGGEIALRLIDERRSDLKADSSVITEADRSISRLTQERLRDLIATGDHVLIDEEDPRRGDYLDEAFLQKTRFVWSVDPIDATRAYANRMPQYGISLGLMKDRKPWMGVVYFPSLGELFCCDGRGAFFVQKAFTDHERKTPIVPIDEVITSRSVFIATDEILTRFEWTERECRAMVFSAAVCEFCWPAIGRGCGSLSSVHLWDFAGSWPIFERAGLKLRSFEDGHVLDRLEAGLFRKNDAPWRLKDFYILSSERNYPVLKGLIKRKK